MGEEKGDFGFVGGALERTKAAQHSNILAKYDGILIPGREKMLRNFATEHNLEMWKSTDTLQDDRLLKYTVHQMVPTKKIDEFENPSRIYLITDASGFDIGTYDESTGEFKLSETIMSVNKGMLNKVPGSRGLEKEFTDPSFSQVLEKLAKGETLVLTSEEQVKDEIVKEAKQQFSIAGQEYDTEEISEDEGELDDVPEGQKALVTQIKEKIPNVQIKEVLVINSPDTIVDDLTENSGIKKGGEPVVIVTAVNKEGGAGMDDVYMFQGENELPNIGQDKETILEIVEQHKDAGTIDNFRDNEKEDIALKIQQQIYITESKVRDLETQNFSSEEDRQAAIAKEYSELSEYVSSCIDYYDREENESLQQMEEDVKDKEEQALAQAEDASLDDDAELSRWDTANPYNHY